MPHPRWRTATLPAFAVQRGPATLKPRSRTLHYYSISRQSGRAALTRRYASLPSDSASPVTAQWSSRLDTPATEKDTSVKLSGNERDSFVDIIQKAQSTLAIIEELRNEDSKAVEQFSAACEYLLLSEGEADTRIRISVYGSEESSGAHSLVTALLDDPLSSDETLRQVLGERVLSRGDITFGGQQRFAYDATSDDTTRAPSAFFTRFQAPVILEDLSSPSASRLASILTADVPVFVYSPFAPQQSAMNFFHRNPNGLLVIDGGLDPSSEGAQAFSARLATQLGCAPSHVLVVDSARALRGIEALRAAPAGSSSDSARAVAQYQEDVLAAQLPQLVSALVQAAARGKAAVRYDAALTVAGQVASVGRATVQLRTRDADQVRAQVSALQEGFLEARERMLVDVFGGDEEVVGPAKDKDKGPVGKGVESVTKELKPTLDGLKWWRLPFAVDEVSRAVDHAVERAYAREFEKPLVFHTGRLAHLQTHLAATTHALVTGLPASFHSPLLQNTLAQLTTHPSFALSPSSLLAPIEARTAQLAHATRALHLSAQRAVLGSFLTASASCVGSYAMWLSQTLAVDVPTAAGAATLGALAGVRWAVGAWVRARQLWLADCTRVGEGFERDVRAGVERAWARQVGAVPAEAYRFLNEAVERKREGVSKVEGAVEGLEALVKPNGAVSGEDGGAPGAQHQRAQQGEEK